MRQQILLNMEPEDLMRYYILNPVLPAPMDVATIDSSVSTGLTPSRVPQPLYPEPVMTPPTQNVGAPGMCVACLRCTCACQLRRSCAQSSLHLPDEHARVGLQLLAGTSGWWVQCSRSLLRVRRSSAFACQGPNPLPEPIEWETWGKGLVSFSLALVYSWVRFVCQTDCFCAAHVRFGFCSGMALTCENASP